MTKENLSQIIVNQIERINQSASNDIYNDISAYNIWVTNINNLNTIISTFISAEDHQRWKDRLNKIREISGRRNPMNYIEFYGFLIESCIKSNLIGIEYGRTEHDI